MTEKNFIYTLCKYPLNFNLENAKIIWQKLQNVGYNIEDFLGNGSYGIALLLNNKNVLKISKDKSEANSMNKLIGKNFKNVVKVYRVFKFKNIDDIFFIEQERLEKANDTDFELYGEIEIEENEFSNVRQLLFNITKNEIDKDQVNDIIKMYELNHNSKKVKILKDLTNAALELQSTNIEFPDWHFGNIMKKDGIFKITDLGISRSAEANIEMLEQMKLKNIFI